jgi:hypothetical protein
MKQIVDRTVLLVLVGLLASTAVFAKTPLEGAWKVMEQTTTGPNGTTNKNPQPGLIIFTGKYFSILMVNGDKPRAELPQDLNTATAEQFRDAWRFIANTGTYEIKGDELTTHLIVAKNPRAMLNVSFDTFTFKVKGNMLTLTRTGNSDGPVTNPPTVQLIRVE